MFEVKQRKPRKARNPRTGARVDVEAKNVVTFQPGKEMEERVRKFARPADPKRRGREDDADDAPGTTPGRDGAARQPVPAGAPSGA